MSRFLLRAVSTARNSSAGVYKSCVLAAKCNSATGPVSRLTNGGGVKAHSTSSASLCQKKDNSLPSNHDEETNKEARPTETSALATQKTEDDVKVTRTAAQTEEPVVLKTDNGSSAQQQGNVKNEQVKTGKENLLDLLGAMKVEVTSKRRLKNLKVKQNYESPKSKPAAMESTISMFQRATAEASTESVSIDPELVAAASAAAATLPNHSQAESELLKRLRQHEAFSEAQKKGEVTNLGVIIADMKVGKNPNRQNAQPANQIRFDDDGQGYTHDRGITAELDGVRRRRNLFTGKRLNIFSPVTDEDGAESAVVRPNLWDMDFAHQLSESINQKPRNGFEEMIQWTKEGKMWQYPINNEAGLEEEASVPFHEHIFLEKHLEEGFPRQGPVRHFMELVVVGLSKNPYLTVQQKKEHISWFRDYFHQKEDVLREADVFLN
ncbi:small ribosomal subunit protein mS31 [Mastacembelus armatus]|uniref:Small ribosomal subunit protein mS31 n=1 Tax=Mastacembelus armatus TaxID=205130 RepID=A0A3Q3MRK1_9TELE|nr:28S ribosomal protein S31, mitochondrial [Mastacembelus armatus]